MKKLGAFLVGLGLVAGVASAANVNGCLLYTSDAADE